MFLALRLNKGQKDKLADFSGNLGLVFFVTLVMPIFTKIDRINILMIVLGILFTNVCVISSLYLMKGIRKR